MSGTGGTPPLRVGQGFDVHGFSDDASRALVLGGVTIPDGPGLAGHSDADVVCHAVADALLGACGLGDLGRHFPDTDPRFSGVRSLDLLAEVTAMVATRGYRPVNADCTVVCERPALVHHIAAMERCLAEVIGAPASVKATRPEHLGALGRGEGIAALAVVLVVARAS